MLNIAHRGFSEFYPENTMLAFEKALDYGSTAIETDVQITKDGELILIHDEILDRTTNGHGLVNNYTYKELRKLDAGSFKNKDFSNCKIPSLKELLSLIKDKNIILNLELKNSIIFYKNIEEKVISSICEENVENKIVISSFNHGSINKVKSLNPNIKTGLLFKEKIQNIDQYCKEKKPNCLNLYYKKITNNFLTEAHKKKFLINCYTVNDKSSMENLIKMNVDGIITNRPDILKTLL